MIPVILSGGSGTRLWPLSTPAKPKQFHALTSSKTLFQQTIHRIEKVTNTPPLIICNHKHKNLVLDNIQTTKTDNVEIILETIAKNTAPAIAVAAHKAFEDNSEAVLIVLPADHTIKNEDAFVAACQNAETLAQQGHIVTFGIVPETPNTNYGYIEIGSPIQNTHNAYKIKAFKEKPNLETAKEYTDDGNHFWNSGMFVFKASTYLNELKKYAPTIYTSSLNAMHNMQNDDNCYILPEKEMDKCDSISIDYAIMEKTDKGVIIPIDVNWCDVGAWDALWGICDKDMNGNVLKNNARTIHSKNNYLHTETKQRINVVGASDLVVVCTNDEVLILDKKEIHRMKDLKIRD